MNNARKLWMLCFGMSVVFSAVVTSVLQAVPVTDGMLLWLDATDSSSLFQDVELTTPALDGDPIGGWMDKSGNNFHATQANAALQPVRNDTALNGLPAVRFSGTDADGMAIADGLSLSSTVHGVHRRSVLRRHAGTNAAGSRCELASRFVGR